MKHSVFIDANVFLDYLLQRPANAEYAKQLLYLAAQKLIHAYTSSSNLINIIYFLEKAKVPKADIVATLADLVSIVSVISPGNETFLSAIELDFSDLEDAIQYATALEEESVAYFITENVADFANSLPALRVLNSRRFLEEIYRMEE